MPVRNSHMSQPDEFIMDKAECEELIKEYLLGKGFKLKAVESKNDADFCAWKEGWKLLIEVRGNQAVKHDADTVFDSSQISIHLAEQVQVLLKLFGQEYTILVLANPDLQRIRKQVDYITKALDYLNVIKLWVKKDGTVTIEYPKDLESHVRCIGLDPGVSHAKS